MRFAIDEKKATDQYAKLYSAKVVDLINALTLPRYGLGNYIVVEPSSPPTQDEAETIQDLSRAGKRLMGFCRTGLFKRLESSGTAFLLSISRHILRNYVYRYALENNLPVPIGTQDAVFLDDRINDEDEDDTNSGMFDDLKKEATGRSFNILTTEEEYQKKAETVYHLFSTQYHSRFSWLRAYLFIDDLRKHLKKDSHSLLNIISLAGDWDYKNDAKLSALLNLLAEKHAREKVLVFSQFADTVRYLNDHLKQFNVQKVSAVTGESSNPAAVVWRFSPQSNNKKISSAEELRVLLTTDILSEGQNLQDCSIVVNYDLPWAIIRLIQRVGRIGQKSSIISCYTFLPAEGVDRIIQLRSRLRRRLKENSEVVGTDEAFFEDDNSGQSIADLYNEKAGILDGEDDTEVDLASYAYQIWKNAVEKQPELQKIIPQIADVAYSSRNHKPAEARPQGVLVYLKTGEGNDALAYVDKQGKSITESQFEILKLAACEPETPVEPRNEKHHALVKAGVDHIVKEEKKIGGQLGRPSGARFRCYERLKAYVESVKGTLFESLELLKAIDEIYRFPLRSAAIDKLNRQLRTGISNVQLAELVLTLREEDRLSIVEESEQIHEPRIICSMGLFAKGK